MRYGSRHGSRYGSRRGGERLLSRRRVYGGGYRRPMRGGLSGYRYADDGHRGVSSGRGRRVSSRRGSRYLFSEEQYPYYGSTDDDSGYQRRFGGGDDDRLTLDEAVDEFMDYADDYWPWFMRDFEDLDYMREGVEEWLSTGYRYEDGVEPAWVDEWFDVVVFDPDGEYPDVYADWVADCFADSGEHDIASWFRDYVHGPSASRGARQWVADELMRKRKSPEDAMRDVRSLHEAS